MTRDDIIRMAREAGLIPEWCVLRDQDAEALERFAALVAAHTLSNIDPSKLMSHQEGFEAGRLAEREACCAIVFGQCGSDNVAQRTVDAIKARGNNESE